MKIVSRCQVLLLVCLFFPTGRAAAQGTREDYQRAEQFLPGNLRHRIYVADVAPHWIAKKNRFWYRKQGMKATEFILVDAEQNKANKNFDQLIVPNMYHGEGGNPYLIRRRWDYFVQNLLGVTPPPGFAIHEEREAPPARTR